MEEANVKRILQKFFRKNIRSVVLWIGRIKHWELRSVKNTPRLMRQVINGLIVGNKLLGTFDFPSCVLKILPSMDLRYVAYSVAGPASKFEKQNV